MTVRRVRTGSTLRVIGVVGTLVAALTIMGVSPAGAGPFCTENGTAAPDGKVKVEGQPFAGSDHIGETKVGRTVPAGTEGSFVAKWKNVSAKPRDIRLDLVGFFTGEDVRLQFFVDGVNVSRILKDGGSLRFGPISPGTSTPALQIVVKNRSEGFNGAEAGVFGFYGRRELPACDAMHIAVNQA